MTEYPKIETLYDRDEKTQKVMVDKLRLPEFGNIRRWSVTEKVDGMNVRVCLLPDGSIRFGGRTDNAQMAVFLMTYLQTTFTPEKMKSVFRDSLESSIILFGEGYGEKIRNGGNYRKGVSFRLFDVLVGQWWLEPANIEDIASKLGIQLVPDLKLIDSLPKSASDLADILGQDGRSTIAIQDEGAGCRAEGIVARPCPLLLTRRGDRLMWKLKFRDF